MIQFEWLWLLLLLPLPLLLRRMLPPVARQDEAALQVPFLQDFNAYRVEQSMAVNRLGLGLSALAWICLVVAAARPQWLGDPVQLPVTGRDLMLAVDLSGSMEAEDFKLHGRVVDRLTATRSVATEFIQRRVGDRIGLILFGSQAYVQTPLTFDRQTVSILLNEAVIGLAGEATAIGDAIGLAVKRLDSVDENSRVLILLTDGANTAGEVEPIKAAQLAAENRLKIYTIGIGADEMMVNSLFGRRRVNPSAELDEKTLRTIAEQTGGQYFRARNTNELEQIYQLLDELEPLNKESQSFRPTRALFYWPLGLALLLSALLAGLRIFSRGRI